VEDGHDVRGITMWTLVDKCENIASHFAA